MKQDTQHEKLQKLAREELDQSIQDLDENTLTKLKVARKQAVDLAAKINSRQNSWQWANHKWLLPVGGITATAFAVAMSVSIWMLEPNELDSLSLEDIAVLSANEELEFFDELEFYQWLEDEKHSPS